MDRKQLDSIILETKPNSKAEFTKTVLSHIPNAKVSFKPMMYYGYLQGFKVYVKHNGKRMKLPLAHGHWYTFLK